MEKRDGRSERKLTRIKIVDGETLCYCSSEGIFKPCDEFNRCKSYEHGFDYRCKKCNKLNVHSVNGSYNSIEKEQRKILNNFYRQVGYDPESPIPIHEQFLIRHDL